MIFSTKILFMSQFLPRLKSGGIPWLEDLEHGKWDVFKFSTILTQLAIRKLFHELYIEVIDTFC